MIKQYRKKPVVIEAMEFVTNNEPGDVTMNKIVSWVNDNQGIIICHHDGTDIFINTLEGVMVASCGDFIIKGIKGEFYPCKPDIFKATYDEVQVEVKK